MKQIIITALSLAFFSQAIISGFKIGLRVMSWIYGPDPTKWKPVPDVLQPFFCAPCFAFWGTIASLIYQGAPPMMVIAAGCFSYVTSKIIHKQTFMQ